MGASYQTRAVIGTGIGLPVSGGIIREEHLNEEFTAVIAAFNSSTGHEHDGSDSPFIIRTGPAGQLTTAATNITPSNATFDLGTSAAKFQHLFLSGTATIETSIKTPVIADTSGNEAIKITATSSAVNELGVINAATSGNVKIVTTGDSDANVNLELDPKGSGKVVIGDGVLQLNTTAVTSNGAEINILDGDTATIGTTAVAGGDGIVTNDLDATTTRLTSVDTFDTYLSQTTKTLTNKTITSLVNGGAITIPTGTDTLVARDTVDTLTNKTLTTPTLTNAIINTGVSGNAIDTDLTSVSTSDDTLASAKAIKTYVDAAMPVTGADYGSASNPHIIEVTVAAKTAAHPYYGSGSTNAFFLDGVESPVIELNGHDQTSGGEYYYKFAQGDSSNSGHYLIFYEDAAKTKDFDAVGLSGTNVSYGSGTPGDGSSNAWTMIKVSNDTPNKLYYQCGISGHNFMGNHLKTGNLNPGLHDHHTIMMGNLKFTNNKIETVRNNITGATNPNTPQQGHPLIIDTATNNSGEKEPIETRTWLRVYGNHGDTNSYVTVGVASGTGDDLVVHGSNPSLVISDSTNDATTDRGELIFTSKDDTNTGFHIAKIQGFHSNQAGPIQGGIKIKAMADGAGNYNDAFVASGPTVGLMNSSPSSNVSVHASGQGGFLATKYVETVETLTSAATVDIDLENGNVFFVEAAHNITFTFTDPPANANLAYGFTLKVKQDSSGNHTLTWPSTVRWPGGTAPSLTGTAASIDVFTFFTHNGGTDYYGFLVGSNLSGSGGTSQ